MGPARPAHLVCINCGTHRPAVQFVLPPFGGCPNLPLSPTPAPPAGELCKPPTEQGTPCLEFMREEAVEVWKDYQKLAVDGKVQHY